MSLSKLYFSRKSYKVEFIELLEKGYNRLDLVRKDIYSAKYENNRLILKRYALADREWELAFQVGSTYAIIITLMGTKNPNGKIPAKPVILSGRLLNYKPFDLLSASEEGGVLEELVFRVIEIKTNMEI